MRRSHFEHIYSKSCRDVGGSELLYLLYEGLTALRCRYLINLDQKEYTCGTRIYADLGCSDIRKEISKARLEGFDVD